MAEASAEIARFDTSVGAGVAPFAAILLRSESAASSKIENLTASARAIALAEMGDPSRRNASVIVANAHAMQATLDLAGTSPCPFQRGCWSTPAGTFAALDEYRQGDPGALVHRLADASFAAIGNGRHLVSDLQFLRSGWAERVRARRGATAWPVANLLLRQPVVDAASIQRELQVPAMTAHRAIDALADAGVLTKVSGNFRDRKWAAAEVLAALDDFAARAGRRGSPQ